MTNFIIKLYNKFFDRTLMTLIKQIFTDLITNILINHKKFVSSVFHFIFSSEIYHTSVILQNTENYKEIIILDEQNRFTL